MFHDVNCLVWVLRKGRAEGGWGGWKRWVVLCVWMWMYVFGMPVGQDDTRAIYLGLCTRSSSSSSWAHPSSQVMPKWQKWRGQSTFLLADEKA